MMRVWALGIRVWGIKCYKILRVQCLGLRVCGLEYIALW